MPAVPFGRILHVNQIGLPFRNGAEYLNSRSKPPSRAMNEVQFAMG
jgi:hypothetical protein